MDGPMGVLIAGDQDEETARREFEKLVSQVSSGEVKGMVLVDQGSPEDVTANPATRGPHLVRRGALWGACVGFLLGLVPLLASTLIAAAAGGLIAKASELRLEKGTAPRLRFAKHNNGD